MSTVGKMWSRCEVVTLMETPRMGLSDGNPSYGSITYYIASQLRPGRPLEQVSHLSGYTHVCIYTCAFIYMLVRKCGLSKVIWISRVSREKKPRQNGRKMTSFRGDMAELGAGEDNELGGSAPHQ